MSSVLTPPGVEWLTVSSASGTGDSVIEVSVDPALLEGQSLDEFEGEIAITSGSRTVRVEVELEFAHRISARMPDARWILVPERGDAASTRELFDSIDATILSYPPDARTLRAQIQAAAAGRLGSAARPARPAHRGPVIR